MPHRIDWPIDRSLKFPPSCVFCDGPTKPRDGHVTELTRKFGRILVRLRAPLCPTCEAARRKRRLTWIATFFAYAGAVVSSLWLAQRSSFAETHSSLLLLLVCVFLATCFYWFVAEEAMFLRRYTRLWIEGLGPKARSLILATNDGALAKTLEAIAKAPPSEEPDEPEEPDTATSERRLKASAKPSKRKPKKR